MLFGGVREGRGPCRKEGLRPEAHAATENLWLRLQAGAGRVRFQEALCAFYFLSVKRMLTRGLGFV